jgi:hypothetical protein
MDSREPVWPNNIKSLSWPRDGITYSYEQRGYIKPEKLARWLEKAFGQGTAKYVVRRSFISLHRPHESHSSMASRGKLCSSCAFHAQIFFLCHPIYTTSGNPSHHALPRVAYLVQSSTLPSPQMPRINLLRNGTLTCMSQSFSTNAFTSKRHGSPRW